jgi:hypothetical protein
MPILFCTLCAQSRRLISKAEEIGSVEPCAALL